MKRVILVLLAPSSLMLLISSAEAAGLGSNPGSDVPQVTVKETGIAPAEANAVLNISGTYPHLAVFSGEGEIGIGGVVPWAEKLWFITYPPHFPQGSADKLWMLEPGLTLTAHPESVGGTHANRMIHRESGQLLIGNHLVASDGAVRTISPKVMPGRLTAVARHLEDPANRVYYFTMERGLYDVNVHTLEVKTIYRDGNIRATNYPVAPYPGTHGKGGYSGQGRLVYANNGEAGWRHSSDPRFERPAGVLTEHPGADFAEPWRTVERKTFAEVTGPGGIYGNSSPTDPVWATGWDKRSVILKLLDQCAWHTYRLPKASYTHDAFHGWYTEWPRIREITNNKLLMHMHGMFYYFPKMFAQGATAGIEPLCTYLRMPVDYCWWNGQLVMAQDVSSTTGGNKWAGQSNSALWFGQLRDMEQWGAPAGFGGPWKNDSVAAHTPSDPFLVRGFKQRTLHLKHGTVGAVQFEVQYDSAGHGVWQTWTNVAVPAAGYAWCLLPPDLPATWVRLSSDRPAEAVTAWFTLGNPPTSALPALFSGIADAHTPGDYSDGIIRAQSGNARQFQFAAKLWDKNGALQHTGFYEIGGAFQLRRSTNTAAEANLRGNFGLEKPDFTVDDASVIYTEGANRFRLPKGPAAFDRPFGSGWPRGVREAVTERNLFNAHGTFYELPHSDSGGFRRVRPAATHNKRISDFATWRGLFVAAGVLAAARDDKHIFHSDDHHAALWFGNVDDLWRLGAPAGKGGPWLNSPVAANAPSDPFLMCGYQHKVLELSHTSSEPVTFAVEVDFAADDSWSEYARFTVPAGATFKHVFPAGYSAHWVRLRTAAATTATAIFSYSAAPPP